MSIIFVAVPTKGVAADGKLLEHFPRHVARLHERYPEHTFLVPMIQDYALLPYMRVEATWEAWGHHCRAMIGVSDEVWVISYDGYDTSTGVREEIKLTKELNKTLKVIDPSYFDVVG